MLASDSVDIFDPGNPNQEAEGIINDAFDEMDQAGKDAAAAAASTPKEELPSGDSRKSSLSSSLRKSSLDVAEVDAKNIQPNDLRDLVAPSLAADNNSSVDREEEEVVVPSEKKSSIISEGGEDPFDTSAFDADAFDAFESRFESTELGKAAVKSADPFASPYKSAKGPSDDSKNAFDSFEPFVPKQPENTPFHQPKKSAKAPKVKKDSFEDSFDSDGDEDSEAEENIKIVIRAKMKDSGDADGNEPPAIGKYVCFVFQSFLTIYIHFSSTTPTATQVTASPSSTTTSKCRKWNRRRGSS